MNTDNCEIALRDRNIAIREKGDGLLFCVDETRNSRNLSVRFPEGDEPTVDMVCGKVNAYKKHPLESCPVVMVDDVTGAELDQVILIPDNEEYMSGIAPKVKNLFTRSWIKARLFVDQVA